MRSSASCINAISMEEIFNRSRLSWIERSIPSREKSKTGKIVGSTPIKGAQPSTLPAISSGANFLSTRPTFVEITYFLFVLLSADPIIRSAFPCP